MEHGELIALDVYCTSSQVSMELIDAFAESGLVSITLLEERRYIPMEQLARVDHLVRLHDELGINVEGIEAIEHMLERMQHLQVEMAALRNRLRRFGDAG